VTKTKRHCRDQNTSYEDRKINQHGFIANVKLVIALRREAVPPTLMVEQKEGACAQLQPLRSIVPSAVEKWLIQVCLTYIREQGKMHDSAYSLPLVFVLRPSLKDAMQESFISYIPTHINERRHNFVGQI
jgi:hypothetical protein